VFWRIYCQGEKNCSNYADGQLPYAFYEAMEDVAALHRPDARWSSSEDQIARRQCEETRELRNDFWNLPDQGRQIRTLDALAIAFQPQRALFRLAGATAEHGAEKSKAFPGPQGCAIFCACN
jgi:hypothetical protein